MDIGTTIPTGCTGAYAVPSARSASGRAADDWAAIRAHAERRGVDPDGIDLLAEHVLDPWR